MKRSLNDLRKSVLVIVLPFVSVLLSTFHCNAQTKEWVVRFHEPLAKELVGLPDELMVSSIHEPYNIVVVRNESLSDAQALLALSKNTSVLRVEKGFQDQQGSPVYPTGDVLLAPARDKENLCRIFLAEKNMQIKLTLSGLDWIAATLPADISWNEFQTDALASGLFQFVMRDEIITAQHHDSNDPMYNSCWYISQITDKDIDADEAWASMPSGASVKTVAVIDGHGFDTGHPDLVGQWADTFNAVDLTTNISPSATSEKHGTACAGIPGAAFNNSIGIPGVGGGYLNIQGIKIGYNAATNGSFSTSSTIQAAAINRAMTLPSTVCISMSFGSTTYQTAFYNAITQARLQGRGGEGLVVFGSTGNNGLTTWTNYPASYIGVIAVGSTTIGDFRSSFSNYGSELDLSAPGSGIATTDVSGTNGYNTSDYTNFSGTSAACPLAASVAAMMLAANPQLSESEVRAILAQTCDKVGNYVYFDDATHNESSWSVELGYGRINMKNAVIAAQQLSFPLADIIPALAQVNSLTPNVGQSITISVNQTITPASGNAVFPVIEYRWSVDQIWSSDDAIIGTDGSTLGAGTSAEGESISYTVPAGTGTRYILIKADSENAVDESNENNNVIVLTVLVNPAPVLPDITLTGFTSNDLTPDVGQTITITCNQFITSGPSLPVSSTIQYRYSTDQVWSSGDIILDTDISTLSATTTSESESINYTIPSGSGARYILAKVDFNGQVAESNENNNTYILILNVNNPVLIPDINIVQITTVSTNVNEMQSINVLCQQNMTNTPSLAVTVGYECRWSSDQIWSASDVTVATGVSTLSSSNPSETESINFVIPQGTGSRYLLIMADASNQITESNESNVFSIAFIVLPASNLSDIFIDAAAISSSTVSVGQTITMNCDQNISLPSNPAVNVFLEYRWATTMSYSTSYPILGVDFSSLGAGDADDPESLAFTVPAGTGQRYLMIICDTGNNVAESNENNNITIIPVNVIVAITDGNQENSSIPTDAKEISSAEDETTIEVGSEVITSIQLNIYPNPANDYIILECHNLCVFDFVRIFDAAGQLLLDEKPTAISMPRISVSTLPPGLYTVIVSGGNWFQCKQLIIVR
jgi:hypothetical protein